MIERSDHVVVTFLDTKDPKDVHLKGTVVGITGVTRTAHNMLWYFRHLRDAEGAVKTFSETPDINSAYLLW